MKSQPLAGDHCVLMKRAVRGVARKHGFDATRFDQSTSFMRQLAKDGNLM